MSWQWREALISTYQWLLLNGRAYVKSYRSTSILLVAKWGTNEQLGTSKLVGYI